jgi:hypothetical protein
LDKLSVIPGLNCHEAIAGIYESLERLHLWEVERLKEQADMAGKDGAFIERTAMCIKSGKPVMHTRDRLGLSIDYWQDKRRVTGKISNPDEQKTWSLLVECAPLPALVFPPLRVSRNWISADIQKANPPVDAMFLDGPILDWLEPDNTLLPSTEPAKPDAMEGIEQAPSQKVPEVMFLAKFDPPLIMPMGLAMQIYNSTSAALDMSQLSTFDGLMFPHGPNEPAEPSEARTIKSETIVPIFDKSGEKSTQTHRNTLLIDKIDYGRTLTELPFSHPRQLVEMLPALRQYAFLSTVLQKTFSAKLKSQSKESNPPTKSKDEFADFMTQVSAPKKGFFKMDVHLTTQPLLKLRVAFQFKRRAADVVFEIKLNGVVEVTSQNLFDEEKNPGEAKGLKTADLGRMLEITEDLGIWAEFLRRRLEG